MLFLVLMICGTSCYRYTFYLMHNGIFVGNGFLFFYLIRREIFLEKFALTNESTFLGTFTYIVLKSHSCTKSNSSSILNTRVIISDGNNTQYFNDEQFLAKFQGISFRVNKLYIIGLKRSTINIIFNWFVPTE